MSIKISLITITYNSEITIRDTLDSVRKQNYDNLEYIIIDACSTDRTLSIVDEYSDIVSRVISEKDNGISDAMNKGIRLATGDLVGIIHSDDMLENGALWLLNEVWDCVTDVYYGDAIVCTETGEKTHILKSKKDLSKMSYQFCMAHPAVFVSKKCYDQYGVFNLNYRCAMDYDLLLRFYKANAVFKYIDKVLAIYRLGGTNQKYRRRTINEICQVSIANGGNRFIANWIRFVKIIKDMVRPLFRYNNPHNSRVQKL